MLFRSGIEEPTRKWALTVLPPGSAPPGLLPPHPGAGLDGDGPRVAPGGPAPPSSRTTPMKRTLLAAALLAALPALAADDLLPEARKVATSD